jgi:ABC-type antimicrobial peptide transport system permease subunit
MPDSGFDHALPLALRAVQVRDAAEVPAATEALGQTLARRHRPGARDTVQNLPAVLDAASVIAVAFTIALILVSANILVNTGIGIMNILLVAVTEHIRELGVRIWLGASGCAAEPDRSAALQVPNPCCSPPGVVPPS